MHIGFCGPATLSMLQESIPETIAIKGYPFRGSSILINQYIQMGHTVTLFTTSPELDSPREYSGSKLKVVAVPTRSRGPKRAFDFFAAERLELRRFIEKERPDVLHANWTYEFGLAARQSSIPSLLTVHDWGPSIARQNRHAYWYLRCLMQIRTLLYPGALSAPSAYLADKVSALYRKPCSVIPNGIEIKDSTPRLDSEPLSELRVGMLNAGDSPLKNVKTALRAWAHYYAATRSGSLIVAGPGFEEGSDMQKWAKANGFEKGVEFVGSVRPQDVPTWLASLDIFLHPSLEESFGMVLIEAMAAGIPVVAGKESGAVPAVTGGHAHLIDVSAPQAISRAIALLGEDQSLRKTMSTGGLVWSANFDVKATAAMYLDVFSGLIGNRSKN